MRGSASPNSANRPWSRGAARSVRGAIGAMGLVRSLRIEVVWYWQLAMPGLSQGETRIAGMRGYRSLKPKTHPLPVIYTHRTDLVVGRGRHARRDMIVETTVLDEGDDEEPVVPGRAVLQAGLIQSLNMGSVLAGASPSPAAP